MIPKPITDPCEGCVTFITMKYKDRANELIKALPYDTMLFLDFELVRTGIIKSRFIPGIRPIWCEDPKTEFFEFVEGIPANLQPPVIGRDCTIHPSAVIYDNVVIGDRVTIKANAVIGGEGFGFIKGKNPAHHGRVVIGNDVHIGSCTCIDRGTLGDTIIGDGAMIDNLVHIAHNAVIGKRASVIANAMIAGSCEVGNDAWIAPSASVRNGLPVGANAVVGIGAVVVSQVDPGQTVMGNPAMSQEGFKAMRAALKQLIK
jgi:UDP-3-O-[3-hydroxymyristoyl] glucosamine N-acyltransferase